MSSKDKIEHDKAMEEAYGIQVYNNWHLAKHFLLLHIKHHISVLGVTTAIFARDEYQSCVGNLSHNHLILAIDKSTMNDNSEQFIQDLIRTSVMEIIRTDTDLPRLINNGMLKSVDEVADVTSLGKTILVHNCNERCKIRIGPGNTDKDFRCRKIHPVLGSSDPTQHTYISINTKFQKATLDVLEDIGIYQDGKFNHQYFEPKRHMPPYNYNAKYNMSPVISDFFIVLKSMQNVQALDHTNSLTKYVSKYIAKFDESNYTLLCQDIHTSDWVIGKTHLHNTKVIRSKINEDKAFSKERLKNHPKGRDYPHLEIRQIMMGDEEIFTNMTFIPLSTLPYELRPTNRIELNQNGDVVNNDPHADHPEDSYRDKPPMQVIRMDNFLPTEQLMTENQIATYKNHDGKAKSYDQISLFSLRPPELLKVFTNPVDYFRLCYISNKTISIDTIENLLHMDTNRCCWIDCLGREVKLRTLAFEEIKLLVNKNIEQLDPIHDIFAMEMNLMVKNTIELCQTKDNATSTITLDEIECIEDKFIYKSDEDNLLPIPVLSTTSPENPINFLLHIILSLGNYDTELDALTHPSFRDSLRSVKLIGENNDEESLRQYIREITKLYIESQIVYYPNSMKRTETYIVMAYGIFEDVILHNSISIFELPPFSMNTLRDTTTSENKRYWDSIKNSQYRSAVSSLQHMENIPSEQEIEDVDRNNPHDWDPVSHFNQFQYQSDESYTEQKLALSLSIQIINKYKTISGRESRTYTKNVVIYGAPGTGKSFIGQTTVLYCLSKGMNIVTTSLLGVRANALGGIHLHKLFGLPIDDKVQLSPFKCAEKALEKIRRKLNLLHILLTMDVLFIDELSQKSAQQIATIDIIMRKLRNSQLPFGGILIIGSMDNSQIQPINQLPFLTSSMVLTCFQAIQLQHSVRAHGDIDFQRLQQLTRKCPYELRQSIDMKNDFFELAGRILTFVPDWKDNRISPNMMRAFSRIRPAQDALTEYR